MEKNRKEFPHHHLIGLRNLTKDDLNLIFEQTAKIKQSKKKHIPTLEGKTFANLFFEPSTRTRISFELAIKNLGATVVHISENTSSFTKGETLFDTVKNLEALGLDGIIIRHKNAGAPQFVSDHINIPVINAGDGYTEHPTQGLLDVFTIQEKLGSIKDKHIVIVGDILHSRVAKSNIWALITLGAKVTVCGPPTLIPPGIRRMGVSVVTHLDAIIKEVDVINVLRVQYERQDIDFFPSIREFRSRFGITKERMRQAKDNVIVLHPGPINRGIEIDSDVADGPQNVILDQVQNGVYVRMAVINLLCGVRL